MKNTCKNNTQTLPLDDPSGTKPIAGDWANAAQILAAHPFLAAAGVDETFLRNRAREINPRIAAPWIPKPRNNHFPIADTLAGLLEWFAAKAAERNDLPPVFDSAQALANKFKCEKKTILWLTRNGAEAAQLGGSRIALQPVIQRALDITGQIAEGKVTGIDGLEEWNASTELAKKLRLETDKLEDEKLLRRGQMLFSADGTFALNQLLVVQHWQAMQMAPLRDALHGLQKKFLRRKKTRDTIATEIMTTDLPKLLEKLAEISAPKRADSTAEEN